jgi:hypothetical protein
MINSGVLRKYRSLSEYVEKYSAWMKPRSGERKKWKNPPQG